SWAASGCVTKLTTTSAPACPRPMATALPMPELAPVTRAFCPFRIFSASRFGIGTDVLIVGTPEYSYVAWCLLNLARVCECSNDFFSGLKQLGDQTGPTSLVRRADAPAGIAMEILMKRDVVAKMRIVLELFIGSEHRPPAVGILQEQLRQSACQFLGHFGD